MKKLNIMVSFVLLVSLLCLVFIGCNKAADNNEDGGNKIQEGIKINFVSNEKNIYQASIESDSTFEPIIPHQSGYKFLGWYGSEEFVGSTFDFGKITGDTTVYARWAVADLNTVSLGMYPQKLVENEDILTVLGNVTEWDENNCSTYENKIYYKIIAGESQYIQENGFTKNSNYYFEMTPLKWEVLSEEGNNQILICQDIIDCAPYNVSDVDVYWAISSIKTFLNDDFYNFAFNSNEQNKIITSTVINDDNSDYNSYGGDDTNDKVYLLSLDEANDENFFVSDSARMTVGSDFAKLRGLQVNQEFNYFGNSPWWLRSPGDKGDDIITANNSASVDSSGYVTSMGKYICCSSYGIRPVICIDSSIEL